MMARYAYNLGGVQFGPGDPAIRLQPEWRGSPPPDVAIEIVSAKGCDVAPLDLTNAAQALRLKSYVWPEFTERFVRLEAAIAAAQNEPPEIVKAGGADFCEEVLRAPQASGTTRVVMHSVVWQYVSKEEQRRITELIEQAGAAATRKRPIALVSLEASRDSHRHELRVRYWPGGDGEMQLAEAHPHGAWIDWLV